MNETLDYIEAYFENSLTAEERMRFEQRITTDSAFAGEVAFYVQARQLLKQELIAEKEKRWQQETEAIKAPVPVVQLKKPASIRRPLAAAAGIVILIGLSLVFLLNRKGGEASPVSAGQLAQQYTDSAFKKLDGTTMGSQDDFQKGIAAYNKGLADSAERVFGRLYQQDTTNFKALEYSGLAALSSKHYDQAIATFQQLARNDDYAANPALFYEAIARLQRNGNDDKAQAKRLLQQVKEGRFPERIQQKAIQILDHFNQ